MPDTKILPSDFSNVANDMVTVNGLEFACEGMKRVQHNYYTGSPKTVDVVPMDVIEMPKDCLFSNRDEFLITTIEVYYLALYADSLADNPPSCFLGSEESPSTLKVEPSLNQKEELSAAPMPWVHQVDFTIEKDPQPFFSLINDDSGNNGPLYIVRIEINIALA